MGIELSEEDLQKITEVCETCLKAKQTRFPFQSQRMRAKRPLEIIHTDVVGPIETETWDNKKYFVTCLDDYTHFVMLYLLEGKYEVPDKIGEYIRTAEAMWSYRVSKLRCDNGGEYISNDFKNFCKTRGVQIDYSVPHSPQLNGKAERLNRTLLEKVRALLFDSGLEHNMWGEALQVAAYIINRSPTETVKNTPTENWFQRKPDLSRMQIFGSTAYAKKLGKLKKLDSRSEKYIFVGYAPNGYRLFDKNNNKIIVSRDVVFVDPIKQIEVKEIFPDLTTFYDEEAESDSIDEEQQDDKLVEKDNEEFGRGCRIKQKPLKFQDYVMLTNKEAVSGPDKDKWLKAIEDEMNSLHKNNTWKTVDIASVGENKIISNRWVFKIKDDGKYKARLVVRGCEQQYGLDFEETYSPVMGSTPLRMMLSFATQSRWYIKTFDIKTAFLYGDLSEDIFMHMPEGFEDDKKVCKLQKALYGLKQAPLNWNKRLTEFLKQKGLVQTKTEQCIFTDIDKLLILGIYVDDGLLIGSDEENMNKLLKALEEEFEMTTYHKPKTFIGMNIVVTEDSLKLSQETYASNIIERFRMTDAKPVATPMIDQGKGEQRPGENKRYPYREAVGSLLYISNKTRPDLAFAVNYSSRHMEDPKSEDVHNIKRILRYLNGSKELGIMYSSKMTNTELIAYSDADYAGDIETRKSTTGYIIYYAGGPISWCSRKQPIIATSSTESEYISASECTKELLYIKTLFEEMSNNKFSASLRIDNQSTIKLVKKGAMNYKSKHIDVRFKFIKEKVSEGIIDIIFCPTEFQIADICTKPLGTNKFKKFRDELIC